MIQKKQGLRYSSQARISHIANITCKSTHTANSKLALAWNNGVKQNYTLMLTLYKNKARFFLGLVVIARAKHPIPSRSRQLSAVAPMVLRLKTWESRSPPNLTRNTTYLSYTISMHPRVTGAGWSSPVARQAHNLKVTGSNPVPATKL